ncbi:MAG: gliding motility-associated ABC transporter substrate-binding protein GldG [Ferruginibacter sp.]
MNLLKKAGNNKAIILATGILFIVLNWAASIWHTRIDLTNEKRFTLSGPTKKLLRNLEEPVIIDVFLKGNYPSGFRKLASSATDILQEFKEVAGNKVQYNFISPEDQMEGSNVSYGDTLSALGLYPINLTSQLKQGQQQQFVYPVALVHYKGHTLPVTLYKGKTRLINNQELNSAEAMLEYNLVYAISKLSQTEKPVIGYATGNGQPLPGQYITYDLIENLLNVDYRLFTFNPNTQPVVPAEFKVLVIVKPSVPFSDEAKLKLDQYVMNGGKLLLFIDRLNAEMDSFRLNNEVVAYDRTLNLQDLLFRYGARINPDLLMDLQCDFLPFDINGNGQYEFLPWNYFPVLESKSNHPVNKNLGFIAGRFVNSIDLVEAEGIKKTILLSSSPNSRTIATPALISARENVMAPEDEKFKKADVPVAVLLEGKFQSLYANRLSKAMNDSLLRYGSTFLPANINENKMIIVADGDIVLNSVLKNQPIPMGMNPFTYGEQREIPFANKDFLQNSLEYLINENDLSEAKSKDYVIRLLDTRKVNEQRTMWQLINIAVPVIAVILFAIIFQWYRRKKYSV